MADTNSTSSLRSTTANGSPSRTPVPSQAPNRRDGVVHRILWSLINLFFLGFAEKFFFRLQVYTKASESLNVSRPSSDSPQGEAIREWREGQQQEWDRLGTTISLLATIAAASLAFSGIDDSWWVGRALFAGALGLSLCGFFVIHYFGVLAEGMEDEHTFKAAQGEFTGKKQQIVAAAMAVPVVVAAYSTILILVGHCIFVITVRSSGTSPTSTAQPLKKFSGMLSEPGFMIVAGVPILIGIVIALGAVLVAEVMYKESVAQAKGEFRREIKRRARQMGIGSKGLDQMQKMSRNAIYRDGNMLVNSQFCGTPQRRERDEEAEVGSLTLPPSC